MKLQKELTIQLNNINFWRRNLDDIFQQIEQLDKGQAIVLNFNKIPFLRPSGTIMLLCICKEIKKKTGQNVRLDNINHELLSYLKRIDIFDVDYIFTYCKLPITSVLGLLPRNKNSLTVIEINEVRAQRDVASLCSKTHDILAKWLPGDSKKKYRDNVIHTIMEACNNSIEHSRIGKPGNCYFTLQKYDIGGYPEVCISIGDMGIGIKNHLINKYGKLSNKDSEYIKKAIGGLSGRMDETGGMGLTTIKGITSQYNGSFWLHSGKGHVEFSGRQRSSYEQKYESRGTQYTIIMRP